MFDASAYSVAVFGIPLGYHSDKPGSPEPVTDEEWASQHGLTLPTPEEDR